MAVNNARRPDLVILGGGVGGLIVTSVAGQLGLKVTHIEKTDNLGCLRLRSRQNPDSGAKVASLMRRGDELRLPGVAAEIEPGRVVKHVADVIATIRKHDVPERRCKLP